MTKSEALKVLTILQAAYPAAYKITDEDDAALMANVWAVQFADFPAEVVFMAINKLISTSRFAPSIAEVKDKIRAIAWESWDALEACKYGENKLSAEEYQRFARIYEGTKEYKYKRVIEPTVAQMVQHSLNGNLPALGNGE